MSSIPNRRIPSPTSSSQDPAAGNEREMIGPLENVNDLAQSQSSLANSDPPSLADLIIKNCEETAFSGQSELYLPSGTLEILVHRESVKQELGAHFTNKSSDEIDRLATAICGGTDGSSTSYRRVFAILALADATHCIDEILHTSTGICDIDLPLLLVKSQGKAKADLRRKSDPDTPLTCFKNCKFNTIKLFDDWQWCLQAPVLEPISGSYPTFHGRIRLPVREKMSPGEGGASGAFSEVFKVKLHPKHHPFSPDNEESFFALKKLNATDDAGFQKELRMLRKFEKNNAHRHIIPLLTAWRQGDYSYLLFPWAQCDLLGYWESERSSPTITQKYICWVAEQLAGLASGLSAIHEYTDQDDTGTTHEPIYGRHGDIKPENILLFRPSEQEHGTLAIADFGLGVFNSRRSRSNLPSKDIAFTLTYRPPESAIQDAKVSRSWDIWTLGCVYAELVTWLLGGWNLTEHFVEWRMTNSTIFGPNARTDEFFELVEVCPQRDGRVFGTGALVKQKVTRWFEGLHNHQRCTGFAHDILKLVQDKMLIVESATRKRAGSKDILLELEILVNRCSADNSYCTKPERWDLPDESMNEQPAVMVILSTDAQEVARQNRATLQKYSGPTEK